MIASATETARLHARIGWLAKWLTLAAAWLLLGVTRAYAVEGPLWIQGSQVNLRTKPSGDVQTQLDVNEKIFVVERREGWAYVSAPRLEIKGWVAEQYVGKQKVETDGSGQPLIRKAPPLSPVKSSEPTSRLLIPTSADDFGTELGGDLTTEIVISSGNAPARVVADLGSSAGSGSAAQAVHAPLASNVQAASGQQVSGSTAKQHEPAALEIMANFQAGNTDGKSVEARVGDGFIPDNSGIAVQNGGSLSVALDPPVTSKSDLTETALASPTAGAPGLKWNGSATNVVTSPMMLEGSFFAVGGRDMGKISGSDVNLRDKPDPKGNSLARLQAGDKLYLTTFKNEWYEVSVPARQLKGWVHGKYVHEFPKVEITGTQVRLRNEPGTDSEIRGMLDKGEVFYEYERKGGWVKVASSASGINGWVRGDYVGATDRSPSRPYAVKGDEVNFRASPEVDADIIARLPQGTTVNVFGRNEKWSYIEVQGRYGWMYSEYLLPGKSSRGFVVPSSPVGERLIARAKAMSGTPYVWGGESDGGVDCSGLIYKVLMDEGASGKCLPRRASEQMAQLGLEVDKEGLQPGDLVFFTTYKAGPSHVGIYLGDGDFIHASSARSQVTINSLSEGYYKQRFVGARRITEDELRTLK